MARQHPIKLTLEIHEPMLLIICRSTHLQEELQAYRACRQEVPLFAFHGVSASNESQAEAALHEQGPGESPVQAFELVIANKVDACVRPQQV